jgi:exodeoxyribonuclease V alpha subunit
MQENNIKIFEGFIKKIKFEGYDSFYILEVQNLEKEEYILQGVAQNIRGGDYFKAEGSWQTKKGRLIFYASFIEILEPTEEESILEYLSSGIIKGVGKVNAKRIVELFGVNSLKIIDQKPEKLLRIPKLGQRTLTKIINSWNEVKPSEQIVSELVRLGFKSFEAVKIYKSFGNESIGLLKTFPYNISSRIRIIDFKTIDFIVLKMGFPVDSPIRIKGALMHFLHEIQLSGDCIIDKQEVIKLTYNYLEKNNINTNLILESLEDGISKGQFHRITLEEDTTEYIQTERMFNNENELAKRIYQIKNYNESINLPNIDKIEYIEKSITFTEEQENGIITALNNKFSVITGKPGVGKTTVLNEMIKQFEKLDKKVLLCAPTGRAAQKMTESCNKPASTIHRLLEYNPIKNGFNVDEDNPLDCDVIFIDEASMIDIYLMVNLLRAVPLKSQIVIIGDVGQLPSVSAGAVLRDIIDSNKIACARIEKIQRQKGTSSIIVNSHDIDKGKFDFNPSYDKDKLEDFYFLESNTDKETLNKLKFIIENKIKKSFNFNPKKDIQILSAIHDSELGTRNLNIVLQNLLNNDENKYSIKKGDFNYRKEDKIIQIVNNYDKEIFNGDTGTIRLINETGIYVEFDNGKHSEYTVKEMEQILPSYAITGHKSQGSEYPVVIIPIPQVFTQVIDRSWIYTTITRGKSLVIVIGSKSVLSRGIKSEKSRNRKTYLKKTIINIFEMIEKSKNN